MLKTTLGKLQQEGPGLWPGTEWPGKAGGGAGLERVGGGRGSSRTQWAKPVWLWVGFAKRSLGILIMSVIIAATIY